MKLSIVSTLYKSQNSIEEFYQRICKTCDACNIDDFEIIFVNDGSPDNSLKLALSLHKKDSRIAIVDLSRNFGHHRAMMTGLKYASGDLVFLIDSDLEEQPEWLIDFKRVMDTEHSDTVYGELKARRGNWFERTTGNLYYKLFNAVSGLKLPQIATARLMSRRFVDALLSHQETEVIIGGLMYLTGFEQIPYPVHKVRLGKSNYSIAKRIVLVTDSIVSFSSLPLASIFYVGVGITMLSFIALVYVLMSWAFSSHSLSGWTSLIISIWLLGGIMISFLGVIAIYLSKVFIEIKHRPQAIVRAFHSSKS
jgi:putative glycosyltransferase